MATNPDDAGNAAKGAEAQQLRARVASTGKIVAVLLALSTATMAVARYL
jgi:hypothetical protein